MGDGRTRASVIGGQSVAVDQLDDLEAPATLNIYVEKREFRDVMDLVAVACELGKSVRQVRRLISAGAFPESVVRKAGKQFWLRATVREWQKSRLTAPNQNRTASKGRLTNWKDERTIEKEEDRRAARLHPDTLKLIADVREMSSVLATDPAEFERRHPNLRQWRKDKMAQRRGADLVVHRGDGTSRDEPNDAGS